MALWTIETRKSIGEYGWTNTYHLLADDMATAQTCALDIATFERELLWSGATMEDVKVSAWPNPTGQNFAIVPVGSAGMRGLTDPQPAEMCLLAKLGAPLGHVGKKWFRMSLAEDEVQAENGDAVLSPGAGIIGVFLDAAGDLDNALTLHEGTLMIGSEPGTARNSTNLFSLGGIGFRDRDIGWYNKGP